MMKKKDWLKKAYTLCIGGICATMVSSITSVSALANEASEENLYNDEIVVGEDFVELTEAVVEVSEEVIGEDSDNTTEEYFDGYIVVEDTEVFAYSESGYTFTQLSDGTYSVTAYTGNSTYISIPKTLSNGIKVTAIADNFVCNNTKIESVTIPEYVVEIGKNAFKGCTSLRSVTFSSYSSNNSTMFQNETRLTNLRTIGEGAFYGDSLIQSLDLSAKGLTTISKNAFYGCSGVTELKLPGTLSFVGTDAFYNMINLKTVYYKEELKNWLRIAYDSDTAGTHPNSYAEKVIISKYDYKEGYGYVSLNDYEPTSISSSEIGVIIGEYTFAGFTKLQSIDLSNVNTIRKGAFKNCSELKTVTLTDNLKELGEEAFYGDVKISTIYLGENLNVINANTFYGCTGLDNLTVKRNVSSIHNTAFDGCINLSYVRVSIGSYAEKWFTSSFNQNSNCTIRYIDGDTTDTLLDSSFMGYSAVYDGKIGMRFYFSAGSINVNTAKVVFAKMNEQGVRVTEEQYFKNVDKASNYYIFTVTVTPQYANEDIGFYIDYGNGTVGKNYWLSFVDYAVKIISNEKYGATEDELYAVQSMLTYCDAVQKYFGINYGTIESRYLLSGADLWSNDETQSQKKINDSGFAGYSLVVNNTISLKIYYYGDRKDIKKENITMYNYGTLDCTVDSIMDSNGNVMFTVITINNLEFGCLKKNANKASLNKEITIKTGRATDVIYGLSYLYEVAHSSQNSNLTYLADAIYTLNENISYLADSYSDVAVKK